MKCLNIKKCLFKKIPKLFRSIIFVLPFIYIINTFLTHYTFLGIRNTCWIMWYNWNNINLYLYNTKILCKEIVCTIIPPPLVVTLQYFSNCEILFIDYSSQVWSSLDCVRELWKQNTWVWWMDRYLSCIASIKV